ncbi:hypothetical protein MKW98_023088 [Papaver atlanticum]|uniref:DUF1985 domain-containing protein n=1 Tax=Papaver atlanticum TaxID=357466 RepID=A0AAD4TAD8_9MAGN|nr:hypothetical protein MKW98_023088 [Papaver atlanticum]
MKAESEQREGGSELRREKRNKIIGFLLRLLVLIVLSRVSNPTADANHQRTVEDAPVQAWLTVIFLPFKSKFLNGKKNLEKMRKKLNAIQMKKDKEKTESEEEEVSSGNRPYRAVFCGLSALVSKMNELELKLNEEQMEVLMESPFRDLFVMFLDNNYGRFHWSKTDESFTKLLRCFKGATKHEIKFEFVQKGEKYIITSPPQELGLILGMPCIEGRKRETKKAMYGGCFRESEFYRRNFGEAKSATKELIQKAIFRLLKANVANEMEPSIRRRDNEDLAMLIGLYMCNTLFFTTKDAITIKEKYLGLVDNFNKCKTLSWAHLIHAHLAKRINKSFNNPQNITGCVVYLPVSYKQTLYAYFIKYSLN